MTCGRDVCCIKKRKSHLSTRIEVQEDDRPFEDNSFLRPSHMVSQSFYLSMSTRHRTNTRVQLGLFDLLVRLHVNNNFPLLGDDNLNRLLAKVFEVFSRSYSF